MQREALEHTIKHTVDTGPSELEFKLLNIISMFDETMKLFCAHSNICSKYLDRSKPCNCGADAAEQTYVEIQTMLNGEVEH